MFETAPALDEAFPDLPHRPSRRLIKKCASIYNNYGVPLTGYRRGWLIAIMPQAAYALQLWPRAQLWICKYESGWQCSPKQERSPNWLNDIMRLNVYSEHGPVCLYRQPGGNWSDRTGQLVLPALHKMERQHWWCRDHARKVFEAIPQEVDTVLNGIPSENLMQILQFAQLGPRAIELLVANRGVGVALACAGSFNRMFTPAEVAKMIAWPQRRILAELGFPGTELVRLVMRDLRSMLLSVRWLKRINQVYSSPETAALLRSTHTFVPRVLTMLGAAEYRELCTPKLIEDCTKLTMAQSDRVGGADGLRLLTEAARFGLWRMRPLQSYRHYEKQVTRIRRAIGPHHYPLPAPPSTGNEHVIPLRSATDMVAEGRELHHCLGGIGYLLEALAGRRYYFRVLQPRRGTIELRRKKDGRWRLGEFRWMHDEKPNLGEVITMDRCLHELIKDRYDPRILRGLSLSDHWAKEERPIGWTCIMMDWLDGLMGDDEASE